MIFNNRITTFKWTTEMLLDFTISMFIYNNHNTMLVLGLAMLMSNHNVGAIIYHYLVGRIDNANKYS